MKYYAVFLIGLGGLCLALLLRPPSEPDAGGEVPDMRRVDLPGIMNPPMVNATDVDLSDDEFVVGVVVDDVAHAYPLRFLTEVEDHLVNTMINNRPVSVCYCDHSGCVTAYTDSGNQPLDIRIGGLEYTATGPKMMLIVKEELMGQESAEIPYERMDFKQTSWADWCDQYPDTKVFLGRTDRLRIGTAGPAQQSETNGPLGN